VLQKRSAVCDGFASLFKALAQAAGLKAAIINGYAKGFGYLPGTGLRTPPNHAWNAIFLDNRWHLLDASMGSGYVNRQQQLVRQFRPYYFLTPPETFIYDHFPLDARWQLIDPPISRQTFEELVWLRPHFFNHGLQLLSHPKAIIATDSQDLITLRAPDTALVLARLEVDNRRMDERYTFVQKQTDKVDIHVILPEPGQYRLRLYVKPKGLTGKYKAALDYVIQASKGSNQNVGFPKAYAPFNEHKVYLHHPLSGYLKTGQDHHFKIDVPRAEKVAIVIGTQWLYLTKTNAIFEGILSIPKGPFGVYAKFPDQDKFHGLLEYTGL
jgi:transglutaminase/protease-like cytokinesis protein 3